MKDSQIAILKKRNEELNKRFNEMQERFATEVEAAQNKQQTADDLIMELAQIRDRWLAIVQKLEYQSERYEQLMYVLKNTKKNLERLGWKVPLYKRIILRFRNKGKKET